MPQPLRFGRRIALPSTRQIRHELIMMMQDDQRRLAAKTLDTAASVPPIRQELLVAAI